MCKKVTPFPKKQKPHPQKLTECEQIVCEAVKETLATLAYLRCLAPPKIFNKLLFDFIVFHKTDPRL